MSIAAFQAVITLTSVVETSYGSGIWTIDFSMIDNEGVYTGYDVTVGDVIVLDTSGLDTATLSRYTITDVISTGAFNVTVVASFDIENNTISPDLSSYELTTPGLITRRTPNLALVNVPSIQIQGLPDKFAFYLINFMSGNIVDNISTTGGGVKPDWEAALGTPTEILNKPILGTAAALDVPATGDATTTQVVLGSDTRLAGGSDQVLNVATPTPTTIGGITAGTTFNNIPVETVLLNLLYPYQAPSFTAFSISGQSTPIEVGASIASGLKTFNWTLTNPSNVSVNSVSISDITTPTSLGTNLSNDGTEAISISAITKITATNHTWRISATNTQSSVITRDYTVNWQWRRFFGESVLTALIATEVQALRVTGLATAYAGTYSFNAGGYKYIAYPTVFGTAISFKDQSTNLDVPFQPVQILSITNSNGITTNYNVHRTVNVIGSSMNIVVA